MDPELKNLIEAQGQSFEAFKKSHVEELKELKKGIADPVLQDRIGKIEKSLDAAVEAKAAMEAGLAAERKEREELELRLSKLGKTNMSDEKKSADIADLNAVIGRVAQQRQKAFTPLDEKAFDAYHAASVKYLREGTESMSADEQKTLSVGSEPDGGYFVTPDVSGRMAKKVFETSYMREISSVQAISTDRLEGIEDLAETGVGYEGETGYAPDTTTPTVGKWAINVYWMTAEPKTTQQILDDANIDVEAWLAGKVADKFARFENAEFVNGATKIRGIMSYPKVSDTGAGVAWGSVGYAPTGTAGAFAASGPADALMTTQGLLKNFYLSNARWLTKRSVITAIRKFKDSTGQYLWQPSLVAGAPETLLGFPVTRAEDMPEIATDSFSIAFGDFSQAYQIVDRQGLKTMRDNVTNKPYTKFYTRKRSGGGLVNSEAVKFLKFGTS